MTTRMIGTCPRPGCHGAVIYQHYLEDLRKRVPVCIRCGWEGEAIDVSPRTSTRAADDVVDVSRPPKPWGAESKPAPSPRPDNQRPARTPMEETLSAYQHALWTYTVLDEDWRTAVARERQLAEQRAASLTALLLAKAQHDATVAELCSGEAPPAAAGPSEKNGPSDEAREHQRRYSREWYHRNRAKTAAAESSAPEPSPDVVEEPAAVLAEALA
ncbi:MAG: hypothetical protein M1401_03420 [Chloroflexi bacterium]|nr:hypothetical protein [Chloroflexota bacterium]MCL5107916.1 hypothetical protein [Chloroflexota bacterium]